MFEKQAESMRDALLSLGMSEEKVAAFMAEVEKNAEPARLAAD